MYKFIFDIARGTNADVVFKTDANMTIPFDPSNTDYQAYLKWLDEGNTPEPADPVLESN
jgi:hypothetical protein